MYIGSIGEPTTLNPLQAADSAAGSVTGVIFNGLLKYNADLVIEGDLAESWSLRQRSTFFFARPADAIQAAANMESQLVDRAALHLEKYAVDGDKLVLDLTLPGVADSQKLAALFGVAPIAAKTLGITAPKPLGDALQDFSAENPAARIVRAWTNGNLGEVVFLGDADSLRAALQKFLAARFGDKGLAVDDIVAPTFLAEPEVTFRLRDGVRWQDGAPFT